jgi:hypothetical protein
MPSHLGAVSPHELFTAALGLAAVAVTVLFPGHTVVAGPCTGPGAPTYTETQCLTAISIPGNPLRSFDISWSDPDRGQYFFSDRSNAGVDVIDTHRNMFQRTLGGFVGVVLNGSGAVDMTNLDRTESPAMAVGFMVVTVTVLSRCSISMRRPRRR